MSTTEIVVQPATKKSIKDAQTGKEFEVIQEGKIDIAFAWLSAAYSIAVIGYLTWLVLEMLYGQTAVATAAATAGAAANTAATPAPPPGSLSLPARLMPILAGPTSKLIFYTAVGGAIGAAVNNLRSFIAWHAEEQAFGWRFIWKYLAMPPLGGTLAVLVYGILQGGMAIFSGGASPDGTNPVTSLSAWATGTLAGYGSHKVFKWLDDKVNTLFKVDAKQTTVPDVKGKSLDEAKQALVAAQLEVGKISEEPVSSSQVGKVVSQTPVAGNQSECGQKVDLTIGIAGGSEDNPNPSDTDLAAKPSTNGNSSNGAEAVNAAGIETATVGAAEGIATNTGETIDEPNS